MSDTIDSLPSDTTIALIWDFRGPSSAQIAAHHKIHLQEFMDHESLPHLGLNVTPGQGQMHSVYLLVNVILVNDLRELLKPNRGQKWQD